MTTSDVAAGAAAAASVSAAANARALLATTGTLFASWPKDPHAARASHLAGQEPRAADRTWATTAPMRMEAEDCTTAPNDEAC